MLDNSLRRRLEALNREPLPNGAVYHAEAHVRTGAAVAIRRASLFAVGSARPTPGLLEIGEEVETHAGKHLRIVQPVESLWTNGERLVAARHSMLRERLRGGQTQVSYRSAEQQTERACQHVEVQALVNAFPDRVLFLDLETCGLAGSALFLVGLLRRSEGRLIVELLLARNYAEEKAVLVSLWQQAAMHDVLVTFNGKSFDWPMVRDRSTRYLLHRIGPPRPNLIHVDVLHHARRRWKGRLPDCKLKTLERYVCGRRREDDIPGAAIPAAYQRFVETGDGREMERILLHNAMDLVTLLDLALRH